MLNNTTSTLNQYIESDNESAITNDSLDAIIFIIIVLLFYSSSFVFLLGMQMRTSVENLEESINPSTKLFVQNFRDLSHNKEILEELVNKQKRDKLWDIYLGTSGDMNDKIIRAEIVRIRNIEKQLATMNERHRSSNSNQRNNNNDNFSIYSNLDQWSSVTDLSTSNSRLRTRRRSSLDYKILEDWKVLGDELKIHENWPWAIQKLIIRRQLRRQQLASECGSAP
ncbi:unnamed protein product [Rotaria sp. Silwood1]|nr:unnamed protein product [Rotaria sp. Silwood1]